jgi:neutral ceramidase
MQENNRRSRRNFIREAAGATAAFGIGSLLPLDVLSAHNTFLTHPAGESGKHSQVPGMKAGFAEADISPRIGMEQPGDYGKMFHTKTHDPCKVRAVVFDDGAKRVALVGIDALFIPGTVVETVRKQIESRCGIAADCIMIGASHSHSSGPIGMIQPGEYDDADPLVRTLAYDKSSCADAGYLELVKKQLVEAVCNADQSRNEVTAGIGKGNEDTVAFNRRFRMKNGSTYTHPGQLNPDIVKAAGPIDPEVIVAGVWNKEGKCIGCVVNYACHATCNPEGSSANWIYYLEQTIRGTMGQDCIVVFLQGACGDVTQVNNLNPDQNRKGEDWARFVGGRVGAEAVRVLLAMPRSSLVPLDAGTTVMSVKRRIPDAEHVKEAYETVKQSPETAGSVKWIFAKETVLLDHKLKKEPVARVEVQAIQVGPAVFISNPAELFCAYGLTLKAKSPFRFTIPVELANDCVGYVPTEEAFGIHGGGYETRLTSYSNLEPDSGNKMVNAGLDLVRKMTPGHMPQPVKAPPFHGKPWEYGSVKPELH